MQGPGERPVAVLLLNLGTPSSPATRDVRRYLREFLGDPRVIDLPAPARWLLLHAIILPFRSRSSAHAYRSIWTPEGSPLRVHGDALCAALSKELGEGYRVALAMRYGEPRIADALETLLAEDPRHLLLMPLFPQYASSSFGSAAQAALVAAASRENVPPLELAGAFYDDPGFVAALAQVTRAHLEGFTPDHLLMSFHGLPERHVRKADPSGRHCLASASCCDAIGAVNRHCYRAQCLSTARALADALGLEPGSWTVSFQSRLGRERWLAPYTDRVLAELRERGVQRLAVVCPAFVADCLETLEEIGIRARAQWHDLGGEGFELVPCLNAHPSWVSALALRVRALAGGAAG